MGKYDKGFRAKKWPLYLIGFGGLLVLAVLLVLFWPREEQPEVKVYDPASSLSTWEGEYLPLTLESVTEEGENVIVKTSYATFQYPYAFSDVLRMEVISQEEERRLEFTARLPEGEEKLFDLCFYSNRGIPSGTLQLQGQAVSVSVLIYEPGIQISGDALNTYYAAQELLNDIFFSLEENPHFIPQG